MPLRSFDLYTPVWLPHPDTTTKFCLTDPPTAAGSGWLVVTAAAMVSVLVFAALWSAVGMARLRVSLELPTDATAGETFPAGG